MSHAAARDAFGKRRGQHFAQLDAEHATGRAAKEKLVEQAEQLARLDFEVHPVESGDRLTVDDDDDLLRAGGGFGALALALLLIIAIVIARSGRRGAARWRRRRRAAKEKSGRQRSRLNRVTNTDITAMPSTMRG